MPKITVYSASWCPYCHAIMAWLEDLGIKYQEVNIEDAISSGRSPVKSIPATKVGDIIIYGFDRPAILKLIKETR